MKTVRGRGEDRRITGQAPAERSERDGELRLAEPEDEMTREELAKLDDALSRGFESARAGRVRPVWEVIDTLRLRCTPS
jgi:hypothetical protein